MSGLIEGSAVIRLREHGYQETPDGPRAMLDCEGDQGREIPH